MSARGDYCNAIYLFQATPCSPCGTIFFRTKPICFKRMRRLVSVGVFYTLGGGYITYGKQSFSSVACLFLTLIASVSETKMFPS